MLKYTFHKNKYPFHSKTDESNLVLKIINKEQKKHIKKTCYNLIVSKLKQLV